MLFVFYNMEYHVIQLRAEVKELHYQRDLAQNELDKFRKRFAEEEKAADKNMVHISIVEFPNKTMVKYRLLFYPSFFNPHDIP